MFSLLFAAMLFAMGQPSPEEWPSDSTSPSHAGVRVVPVRRTPESNTVVLRLAYPEPGEVVPENPVWLQLRIDGFSLGAASQFERAEEIPTSPMGQTIHVVVDDRPYFALNEPALDPFDESGYFYDTSYKVEIPFSLSQGIHTLRLFPARSYGESLKGEETFAMGFFYVGKKGGTIPNHLQGPCLTYNEPSDQIHWVAQLPVLLDFYLSRCELSSDGYKVHLTIDGNTKRSLSSWQPYYIYGLTPGNHTLHLQLVDRLDHPLSGPYNSITRTITVY